MFYEATSTDQLLMTLVELRLSLKVLDLAFRFGVFPSAMSRYRYVMTLDMLLLKEVDWMLC